MTSNRDSSPKRTRREVLPRVLIGFAVLLGLLGPSPARAADEFVYFLSGHQKAAFVLDPKVGQIVIGHRGLEASFSTDYQFDSVASDDLSFSIPKRAELPTTWERNSVRHTVLGTQVLTRTAQTVTLIKFEGGGNLLHETVLLYSHQRGVVGFEWSDGGLKRRAMLKGRCGFAAHACSVAKQ